ncbi:MAG: response regulator [Myroides sp.]|nr:response regulator [Myroides sp.]
MNILQIDDQQAALEGTKCYLKHLSNKFYQAKSWEQAYNILEEGLIPDVVLLEYSLPPYKQQSLYNGIDCAALIRKYAPKCRIIINTGEEAAYVLYKIYAEKDVDAIIVKSDVKTEDLINVVNGKIKERYLCGRAQEAVQVISQSRTFSDLVNLEILMYLWRFHDMGELENIFGLSKSAIQKRISKMMKEFKMTDRFQLIRFLKEKKII